MQKVKISAVSYINTSPFIWGIEQKDIVHKIILERDIPSVCANKLMTNEVDIGLVPVVILPELTHGEIITDYCIGATGNVGSVFLVSNSPLEKIQAVYLDFHSRTSIMLAKILASMFWKIKPEWKAAPCIPSLGAREGAVIIGDKAFKLQHHFEYQYDLAYEWNLFTNLPFVFAAWIANKKIETAFIEEFNGALQYGTLNIDKVAQGYPHLGLTATEVKQYLSKNLSFLLDNEKRKGMQLFLKYVEEMV